MAGAIRKSKLTRYNVTLERTVKQTIKLELTARTTDEACDMARNWADNEGEKAWASTIGTVNEVTDARARAKPYREPTS